MSRPTWTATTTLSFISVVLSCLVYFSRSIHTICLQAIYASKHAVNTATLHCSSSTRRTSCWTPELYAAVIQYVLCLTQKNTEANQIYYQLMRSMTGRYVG